MTPDTTTDTPTLTPLTEAAHDPAPVATGPQAARAKGHKQAVRDQIATQLPMAVKGSLDAAARVRTGTPTPADARRTASSPLLTTPPAMTTTTCSNEGQEGGGIRPSSLSLLRADPRANLPPQLPKWRGNSCASVRRLRIL